MKRMTAYWWDKDKNAVAISYKDNRLILTVDDAQALLRQLEMLLPEGPSRDEPEGARAFTGHGLAHFFARTRTEHGAPCSSMAT